jgi:hypothetical protein
VRELRNVSGFDRIYTSVELEWELPITKRLDFGGSYAHIRFLNDLPSETGNPGRSGSNAMNTYLRPYFDQKVMDIWGYSSDDYRPLGQASRDHTIRAYLNFDLSNGKLRSNVTLRGSYESGTYFGEGITYGIGRMLIPGVIDYAQGNSADRTDILTSNAVALYFNRYNTNTDGWSSTLRYNLSLPLVARLSWFVTVDISNPFNHRGQTPGNWSLGHAQSLVPRDMLNSDGSVSLAARDAFSGGALNANPLNPLASGMVYSNNDFRNLYMGRMGGRSFSLQSGLRF